MTTTAFQEMPDTSRVWVYQSNRPFTSSEKKVISEYLENFTDQWKAHGSELAANYSILYDQFVVLAVDESYNAASGCSIDSSVGIIRKIEQEFNIVLLDKTMVASLHENQIELFPFNQAKTLISDGKLNPETLIFNNAIQNLGQFRTQWEIPAKSSWLGRFFN